MESTLSKFAGAVTIAVGILVSAPAVAQQSSSASQSDNASSGQSSSMEQRRNEEKNDWGWLGLLGLMLLGCAATATTMMGGDTLPAALPDIRKAPVDRAAWAALFFSVDATTCPVADLC